jgi:hypothetical protein
VVVVPFAVAGALALGLPAPSLPCDPVDLRVEPDRAPLAATKADAVTPRQTPREILALLGPAHRELCQAPHHCLEWLLDDTRGLRIDFDDPCRRAPVFRREAVHSVRQAELASRAGLWAVPQSQVDALNTQLAAAGTDPHNFAGPEAFYYDGETITLGLFPWFSYQAMAENRPHDDIYCVASKWVGDDLYMLSPENPRWGVQARFRDGQFEESWKTEYEKVGVIVWRFERVPPEQADRFGRELLAQRLRWSYGLNRESETQLCHR